MKKSRALGCAFDAAAYYITFKDRTCKEVYDKLSEKGYCSQEIDETMQKLLEYGYVNDENYALSYIKSNINQKGIRRISIELKQKGINNNIISDALENFDCDECPVISSIIAKRYHNCDFSSDSEVKRIYSYFARRGFKYENISRVISNVRKS